MKLRRNIISPRFLPQVVKALSELKETGGSTCHKIVNHIRFNIRHNNPNSPLRNLSTQVRRALKHATTNGIVKQRAGKFRLNKSINDPSKACSKCRRRKRLSQKRKSRRRRRYAATPTERGLRRHRSESDSIRFESDSDEDVELPYRQLRRRRNRGKKRSKRRRTTRKRQMPVINKNSAIKDSVYPDDHKEKSESSNVQCDNPECLCNVKEEVEDNESFDSPM